MAKVRENIAGWERLLAEPAEMDRAIIDSLKEVKKALHSDRRTELSGEIGEETVKLDDFRVAEDTVAYIDETGNLHRVSEKIFENMQKSATTPAELFAKTRTDVTLYLFGNRAGVYQLCAGDIPECRSAKDKGVIPEKLIRDFTDDYLLCVLPANLPDDEITLVATERGMLKCSALSEYKINLKKYESALLREGDKLIYAGLLSGASTVDLILSDGKRKPRKDPIPVTGRRTYGVRGVKLPEGVTVASINKRK